MGEIGHLYRVLFDSSPVVVIFVVVYGGIVAAIVVWAFRSGDDPEVAIDAYEAPPFEVTDEMVQRAVDSWITAPGDLVHERMRAALEAALESTPRGRP